MIIPLMPKATAVWLVKNTGLTFEQIAAFCGLHRLEVQGIADGEVAAGISPIDPIVNGQLTKDEITRCENDPTAKLQISHGVLSMLRNQNHKKSKYTPVARRQDKPNAIAWLLQNCPELTEPQIVKLIGTTKSSIEAIQNKTHWNIQNIKPKDPVLLGLCSQTELDRVYSIAKQRSENESTERKHLITKHLDSKILETD